MKNNETIDEIMDRITIPQPDAPAKEPDHVPEEFDCVLCSAHVEERFVAFGFWVWGGANAELKYCASCYGDYLGKQELLRIAEIDAEKLSGERKDAERYIARVLPERYSGELKEVGDGLCEEQKEAVKQFLRAKKKWCLPISGKCGTGKSYTAWYILRQWPRVKWIKHPSVIWYLASDLVKQMQIERVDDKIPEHKKAIVKVKDHKGLVCLDDFGAGKITEFAHDCILSIIDHRYNEMLPTVITTMFTNAEMHDKFGAAIHRRITSDIIIELTEMHR